MKYNWFQIQWSFCVPVCSGASHGGLETGGLQALVRRKNVCPPPGMCCDLLPAVSSQSPKLRLMSSKDTEPQSQMLLQVLTKTICTAKQNSEQSALAFQMPLRSLTASNYLQTRHEQSHHTLLWLVLLTLCPGLFVFNQPLAAEAFVHMGVWAQESYISASKGASRASRHLWAAHCRTDFLNQKCKQVKTFLFCFHHFVYLLLLSSFC